MAAGDSILDSSTAPTGEGVAAAEIGGTAAHHERSIISTSALLIARRILVTALGAVSTGVLAHTLDISSFGSYSAALATFYLMQALCDFGFSVVTAREMATRDSTARAALLRTSVKLASAWSVLISVGLATAVAATDDDDVRRLSLLILCPALALTGATMSRQLYLVTYRVKRLAAVDTVINVLQSIGLVLCGAVGAPVPVLAGIVTVATAANTLIIYVSSRLEMTRTPSEPTAALILLRLAMPIGVASVLTSAYFSIDLVLAGYLVAAHEVAQYAAAVKLLTLISVLPGLLMSVAIPGLSAMRSAEAPGQLGLLAGNLWHVMLATLGPACVLIGLYADPVVALAFGREFEDAVLLVKILMGAAVAVLASNVLATVLIAERRNRAMLTQAACLLALNIGLNVWLLPELGISASAWITLLTEVLVCISSGLVLRQVINWRAVVRVTWAPLLSVAAMVPVALAPVALWITAPLAVIAYALVMTLLRGWPTSLVGFLRRPASS